ncbi:hypothetical protein HK098_005828 [Nowakowskiella sp. JEL0407]|nr:hypothetical protein HK098_005828 [Nowakowskiella sp. JEL0407]
MCHKCGEKGHWKDDCRKSKVPDSYTCKICGVKGHWIQDCPSKDGTSPKSRDSNPNLEKHLLIAIGDYNYLTLAKGGLTNFGHILIVPIEHFPSTKCLNQGPIMSHGELAQAEWIHQVERMLKDMEDLKKKIAVVLKGMGYRCIVFEMYPGDLGLGKQVHAHLQIVPIPNEITDEVILDEIKNSCKGQGIYITNEDSGTKSAERPFCIFELVSFDLKSTERFTVGPTPEVFARYKEEKVVYDEMVASGRRAVKPLRLMNAQFGRIVLANVLNLPDRVDWKRCCLGEEEEKKQMVTLKKVFGDVFN